jgi:hypothetical protein
MLVQNNFLGIIFTNHSEMQQNKDVTEGKQVISLHNKLHSSVTRRQSSAQDGIDYPTSRTTCEWSHSLRPHNRGSSLTSMSWLPPFQQVAAMDIALHPCILLWAKAKFSNTTKQQYNTRKLAAASLSGRVSRKTYRPTIPFTILLALGGHLQLESVDCVRPLAAPRRPKRG